MTIADLERRFMGHRPGLLGVARHYAVLVPLVEWEGELCLLLEVRADTLNKQPGEVCFPGGRMEPGENPIACACRETEEELGICAAHIRTIAQLDVLHHQGDFLVHPVLAQIEADAVKRMSVGSAEVKETFLPPLSFFTGTEPVVYTYPLRPEVGEDFPYDLIGFQQGYDWKSGRVEVPIWRYGDHAVWGMTARVIRWLISEGRSNSQSVDAR